MQQGQDPQKPTKDRVLSRDLWAEPVGETQLDTLRGSQNQDVNQEQGDFGACTSNWIKRTPSYPSLTCSVLRRRVLGLNVWWRQWRPHGVTLTQTVTMTCWCRSGRTCDHMCRTDSSIHTWTVSGTRARPQSSCTPASEAMKCQHVLFGWSWSVLGSDMRTVWRLLVVGTGW